MCKEYIGDFKDTPENMLPGEDVKKIERRYNNFTAKQLKAIKEEC